MCVFNHDEAKGSQATLLIIIQSLRGLIRRSGLIHFDWDLEILALNSLQRVGPQVVRPRELPNTPPREADRAQELRGDSARPHKHQRCR